MLPLASLPQSFGSFLGEDHGLHRLQEGCEVADSLLADGLVVAANLELPRSHSSRLPSLRRNDLVTTQTLQGLHQSRDALRVSAHAKLYVAHLCKLDDVVGLVC